ncbi:MAG: TetR/AcrR family transcriptional regulator [Pseudomonadota bacterium]
MEARTQKSELTRAAIVGAALDVALEQGLEALSLQSVADRVGLSKSGVFSRVGSREALQMATIEEFSRRFISEVFVPAMQQPKGLPRLDDIMRRWIRHTHDVEAHRGCLYSAGAFELDDCEGPLRDALHADVLRWRAALRRTVLQCMEQGHFRADTSPEQVAAELNALVLGLLYDARFLRDAHAAERAEVAWQRIRRSYLA